MSTIGVVLHPIKADTEALREALEATAHDVRWYETSEDDAGQQAARRALDEGCELLIASGGDGTVRAVAEALEGSEVPLGIVPAGTGNLLARNLGLPLGSAAEAVGVALESNQRRVDVGWADVDGEDGPRRYAFVVMAGFGLDSRMIVETDEDFKSKAGWLAYIGGIAKALKGADVVEVELREGDGEPERVDAHTIMIGNCSSIQGGVKIFPSAQPDDGVLDLVAIGAQSLTDWLGSLRSMLWSRGEAERHEDDESPYQQRAARSFSWTTQKPVTFEVDGDDVGDVTSVSVTLAPASLIVRVPTED